MAYTTRKVAAPYTLEHRVYIEKDGVPVSPFHDIPLFANQEQTILNMVVEIPRWTNAKLEVSFGPGPRPPAVDVVVMFLPPWRSSSTDALLTYLVAVDLQGGAPQPHQAGYQEGQASLCPQLLPPQGIPVELRCLPSGMTRLGSPPPRPQPIRPRQHMLTGPFLLDLGGPQRCPPRDQGQG